MLSTYLPSSRTNSRLPTANDFAPNPMAMATESTHSSNASYESLEDSGGGDGSWETNSSIYVSHRLYRLYCRVSWYFVNITLLVSLMSFNFGMLVQPRIYAFFLPFIKSLLRNGKELQLIDIVIISVIQLVLATVAICSTLILLYSTCKVLNTLRKQAQLKCEHISLASYNLLTCSIISYEKIACETLGVFMSKLLALVMTLYMFAVSIVHVVLLKNMFDMALSSIQFSHIASLFCSHQWYLNDDLIVAFWTIGCILLFVGIISMRSTTKNFLQKITSLSHIKKFATSIGFVFVIFFTTFIVYLFVKPSKGAPSTMKLFHNATDHTHFNYPKLLFLNFLPTDPSQLNDRLGWIENNLFMFFAILPLLLTPFHLNDIIITLLFNSQKTKPLVKSCKAHLAAVEAAAASESRAPSIVPPVRSYQDYLPIYEEVDSVSGLYPVSTAEVWSRQNRNPFMPARLGLASAPMYSSNQLSHPWNSYAHQSAGFLPLAPPPLRSSSALGNLMEIQPTPLFRCEEYIISAWSFTKMALTYLIAMVIVCTINIVVNYMALQTHASSPSSPVFAPTNLPTSAPIIPPQWPSMFSIELNFLSRFFVRRLTLSDTTQYHLFLIAMALLICKTTFTLLLIIFRGLLSLRHLTTTTSTSDEHNLYSGLCWNSVVYTSPFMIWNYLALICAFVIEFYPSWLHVNLLLIGWLSLFTLFIYPGLLLAYLSFRTLNKKRCIRAMAEIADAIAFKSVGWPKLSLIAAMVCCLVGVVLLIFGPYSYAHGGLVNVIHFINAANSSSLFCNPPQP